MRGINSTRSQESKQYMVIAGAFLLVFSFAVGLGVATRQLGHAIDPDMIEHRSTNRLTQMTPEPEMAEQPAETRQGEAMERQAAPTYACKSLNTQPLNAKGTAYSFNANVSTTNGASLQKLVYSFSDGTASVTKTSEGAPVSHTFTKAGSFTVKVTSHFSLPEGRTVTAQSAMCSVLVSVPASAFSTTSSSSTTPPASQTPAPSAPVAPKQEVAVVSTTERNPNTTVAAADTKKPQTTAPPKEKPEQLPKTGAEGLVSWFIGVTLAATGLHVLYQRRTLQL